MTAACVLQTFPDTARAHAMILSTGSCCGQGERPVEYLDRSRPANEHGDLAVGPLAKQFEFVGGFRGVVDETYCLEQHSLGNEFVGGWRRGS